MDVELGMLLASPNADGIDPVAQARYAEGAGLDSVWMGDHLAGGQLLDAPITVAAAAGATSRIAVGLGVFLPALRPRPWAYKQVGTLSHLIGPRLRCGVGIGGIDAGEWELAGVPFPDRAALTDAFLDGLPAALAGDAPELDGQQLTPPISVPSLWIGGGVAATLRRTVRHGAGWLAAFQSPEQVHHKRARLAELAAEQDVPTPRIGLMVHGTVLERDDPGLRDAQAASIAARYGMPVEQLRSMLVVGTPAQVADRLAEYVDAGVEQFVLATGTGWQRDCDLLADVRARLR